MSQSDLICLSHLRWRFVYQRPNHLMARCARDRRVFFLEEPMFEDAHEEPALSVSEVAENLFVCVPRLHSRSAAAPTAEIRRLLDELCRSYGIVDPLLWFYTPMALEFTRDFPHSLAIYDCMDELSGFHGAPPKLTELEAELFKMADLVFTGGYALYEAKRRQHPNVHAFPSSVDTEHFLRARSALPDPKDQADIPRPRLGFFGVIDERMDLELLELVARERPSLSLVMLGPVVKIDPAKLPRQPNIHYLGIKNYQELPEYLAGWDAAWMPFADNASTRFISPTKTLEYLAGGRPVVSTPVRDVVRGYSDCSLVHIAAGRDVLSAIDKALGDDAKARQPEVDAMLAKTSWDNTWSQMATLIEQALESTETRVA